MVIVWASSIYETYRRFAAIWHHHQAEREFLRRPGHGEPRRHSAIRLKFPSTAIIPRHRQVSPLDVIIYFSRLPDFSIYTGIKFPISGISTGLPRFRPQHTKYRRSISAQFSPSPAAAAGYVNIFMAAAIFTFFTHQSICRAHKWLAGMILFFHWLTPLLSAVHVDKPSNAWAYFLLIIGHVLPWLALSTIFVVSSISHSRRFLYLFDFMNLILFQAPLAFRRLCILDDITAW